MKKLFLTLLLLPAVAHNSDTQQPLEQQSKEQELDATKMMLKEPEYLKFVLGHNPDPHPLYGLSVPRLAQLEVCRINKNLKQKRTHFPEYSYFEVGKSLPKADAVIVNTCATMEQNLRRPLDRFGRRKIGTLSCKNPFVHDNFITRFVQSFTGPTYQLNGARFFRAACPCDFYKNLTDEQLEQLEKGTQEASV